MSAEFDQLPSLRKQALRRAAYAARVAEADKDTKSHAALHRLLNTPSYHHAHTVLWYAHARSELRTQAALFAALESDKRIVVPYCTTRGDGEPDLGLWQLRHRDELTPGKWNLLEPAEPLRGDPTRRIFPRELDVAMVPGVAFSPRGERLGNGYGYYDRLLRSVRDDCTLLGLCFECQLFEQIPCGPHDIPVHYVITENMVYERPRCGAG